MQFEIGARYTAEEIQRYLKVGNAGGIRVSADNGLVTRVVVLTVVPTAKVERENPYHDRVEGDILIYSAAGLRGDQSLSGANKRLPEQPTALFPIYGFRLNESRRTAEVRRWEFLGLLQFLRVYPGNQLDREGVLRNVWMFELRVCLEIPQISMSNEKSKMAMAIANYKFDAERESNSSDGVPCVGEGKIRQDAEEIEKARAKLFQLDPRSFEILVESSLRASGFTDVSVTRYTQDNGIDINAFVSIAQWPISGLRVQVQAKRWLHTVGRREVAELRGSLEPYAQGAVVTTSFFSRAAISEAHAPGRLPIVLVDGYRFADIARRSGLIGPL